MTEVSNLLPEWPVRSKGPAGTAAETGSPPRGLADAWRREMERQQQQAWFLPIPPVHTVLPWATEQAISTTANHLAGPGPAEPPPVDPSPVAMTLPTGSSALGSESAPGAGGGLRQGAAAVGRGADLSGTTPGGRGPLNAPRSEAAASGEPPSQGAEGPDAAGIQAGGAVVPAAAHGLTANEDPDAATPDAGLGHHSLVAAQQPLPLHPTREYSTGTMTPLQLGVSQPPLPTGKESALLVPQNVQLQIEELPVVGDAQESASVAAPPHPAAGSATQAPESPMRVHCGWQDGQLTVWIGHDRGHAESAAMLVQAIDRWLATQRLSSAGYVINGEPVRRDSAVRGTSRTREAGEDVPAADDILDHMRDGAAQLGFRLAFPSTATFTSRENV